MGRRSPGEQLIEGPPEDFRLPPPKERLIARIDEHEPAFHILEPDVEQNSRQHVQSFDRIVTDEILHDHDRWVESLRSKVQR